jgi:DNA-binding Lrp family transcriptional regulator
MNLDIIDRKLIDLLQVEFPLTSQPYADLGRRLGISEDEVIHRIEQLRAEGVVRQIGPVFDAGSLGYRTTLVAMRVAEAQLDSAAQLIREHPGISHGYERGHHFNLWFTLALPASADMETELERLASSVGAEAAFALPAIKLFKLGAYFAMDGDAPTDTAAPNKGGAQPVDVELSQLDTMVINELQQDLPLVPAPFATMAEKLGIGEAQFLAQSQSLRQRGIMRRFSASLNHRKAGFAANAMTCWAAPPEKVEAAGRKLASLPEVSHCYERKTNPLWRYNLFAMIHAHRKEECQQTADKVSGETGLGDYVLLFSTREFKKTRVKYLV